MMENQDISDVFISYSHQDVRFADRLTSDLRKAGIRVWRDNEQLYVGDYLLDRIAMAIKSCKLFIAIISVNYKASNWCKHEMKLKLTEEVGKGRIHVLPVRLDDADPEELVPAKGWADFRNPSTYEGAFKNLFASISYHLDPLRAEDKRRMLENMLKQSYVDACYGTLSAAEALARFHTAATMNPDSMFVWRALGYIYHFHFSYFSTAEKYYLRALDIEPDNAPIVRALGVLYIHANNQKLARKFLTRAEELGYSTSMEWEEYRAAKVHYNSGPHGIGGIPILFWDTRESVRDFMESTTNNSDKTYANDGGGG